MKAPRASPAGRAWIWDTLAKLLSDVLAQRITNVLSKLIWDSLAKLNSGTLAKRITDVLAKLISDVPAILLSNDTQGSRQQVGTTTGICTSRRSEQLLLEQAAAKAHT